MAGAAAGQARDAGLQALIGAVARGMTLTTLEGSQLKTAKMGSVYEVNNAAVTCGNLHTANATVYIINTVLRPAR